MTLVFDIALHILLTGTFLAFVVFTFAYTLADRDPWERILRFAVMAAGALVALGAQEAGVSYPTFIVNALNGTHPVNPLEVAGATVIPAAAGIGLAVYLVQVFHSNDRVGRRLLGFICVLAATAFVTIYAQATQTKGVFLGAASLPNVSFLAGLILTIGLKYDNGNPESAESLADYSRRITHREAVAPSNPTRSAGGPATGPRHPRDPFSD